jgi:hypothetical protein
MNRLEDRMRVRPMRLVLGTAFALAAAPLGAQSPRDSLTPGSTVKVAPDAHYKKGGLHRFFFGDHYRDLWATPIEIPVLDLKTYAGGLKPVRQANPIAASRKRGRPQMGIPVGR